LIRVFRPGKTVYSLLEEHCIRRINGEESLPSATLRKDPGKTKKLARRILKGIPSALARIVPAEFSVGGGSSPDEYFPTVAIEITGGGAPETLMEKMRGWDPPIIGVIQEGRVRLFPVTLFHKDIQPVHEFLSSLKDGA
jgi:L-seryl-tRNA(Ser) seleniumtransferase